MFLKMKHPYDEDKAIELFRCGNSTREIGRILNANHRTIRNRFIRRGIWVSKLVNGRQSEDWVKKRVCRSELYVSPLKGVKRKIEFVKKAIDARESDEAYRVRRSERMKGNKLTLGLKHTDEAKRKIREVQQREDVKEIHRRVAFERIQRKSETDIERKVALQLSACGKRYISQYCLNGRYIYDFYVVDDGLLIECDGDYWHSFENSKERDRKKDEYANANGISVIRILGSLIKKNEFNVLNHIGVES